MGFTRSDITARHVRVARSIEQAQPKVEQIAEMNVEHLRMNLVQNSSESWSISPHGRSINAYLTSKLRGMF
jgi:hypothetical protein